MSEPLNPPYPQQRTPEQHDAVRRRTLPIAAVGAGLGIAGLVMLLTRTITTTLPPNLIGVNFSFCAIMMGVGILFYARGTSGTGLAAAFSTLAIITGLVGPMLFAKQSVDWHKLTEGGELKNVAAIAQGARQYAAEHNGAYPVGFADMLAGQYITPDTLLSPFAGTARLDDDVMIMRSKMKETEVAAAIEAHSDYSYVGGDLHLPTAGSLPPEIVVAYAKSPVMRVNLAISFVDGTAKFITLEDAEPTLKACNDARSKLDLPPLARPDSVERALRDATTQP